MPNIKPVNGWGAYAIMDIDELDRLKATIQLLTKLEEGEGYWDN